MIGDFVNEVKRIEWGDNSGFRLIKQIEIGINHINVTISVKGAEKGIK